MGFKDYLSSCLQKFPTSTFKSLFQLFWPLFLSLLARRFIGPINVAFAGRIGTAAMGAVGISYGLLAVTATGLGSGLAVSFETMAAKAYGSGKYHTVGVLLQKAFLFAGFLCVLVAAVWMHIGGILKLIGIPAAVADKSELYLMMYIPSMLGIFFYRLLRGYLIVQKIVLPSFVVAVVGVMLLAPLNYFFVYLFHLKVAGIAIASDLAYTLMVIFLLAYIMISGVYKETWAGFSKRCFLDWGSYLILALPGAFNFLLKSSIHEVALIAIGTIGEVEVAAQTALFAIMKAILTLPFAVAVPMNINISKSFGEGNADEARRTSIIGTLFNFLVTLVVAAGLIAIKHYVGAIFTHNIAVQVLISQVILYAALSFVLESVTTVFFVICLSLRLQFHSTIIYIISSYVIGLPLGITLAIRWKDISFLWCGLIVGFLVQFVMFSILFYWKVDFETLCEERQQSAPLMKKHGKDSPKCSPVKANEDHDRNEDEPRQRTYDIEKEADQCLLDKSIDNKPEEKEEEVSCRLIGLRCLTLSIAIVVLVVSIIIRIEIA